MTKEASLPVRLDKHISRRAEAAAKRLGITKSALVRILVQSFVEHFEANGGRITMPPQWKGAKPKTKKK